MYKISVPLHISTIQRAGRDGLVDNLRKLHAERVFLWLGNCTTDEDKMTEKLRALKENCSFFKEKGFEVGAWIDSIRLDGGENCIHMASCDGKEETEIICPSDPIFREHMGRYVQNIARCGVDLIMLEDDLRYGFLSEMGMGCTCKNHLARMSEILGEEIPLEGLKEQLLSGGRNKYRSAWLKANGNFFREYARELRSKLDEVRPEVRFGPCSCMSLWDFDGVSTNEISRILAGKTKPFMRMIGAPYWPACNAWGNRLQDVIELERMECSWCDEDVELMGEGDVYPRPRFACPASYLEGFDTALRADGRLDGILKYALNYTSSANYETGYVKRHVRNESLYQQIETYFSGKTGSGVRIWEAMAKFEDLRIPEEVAGTTDVQNMFFSPAARMMSACSIPTVYEGLGVAGVAFGENIKYVSEDALDSGLILDARAAEILMERGVDVGITGFGETIAVDEEHFFKDDEYVSVAWGKAHRIRLNEKACVQSEFLTKEGNIPASWTYVNEKGQKFLIYSFDAYFCRESLYRQYCRSRQLADMIRDFFGNPLPAYSFGNPDLYLLCKEQEGSLTVGLWNFFQDSIIEPVIELGGCYERITFINCTGELQGDCVVLNEIQPYAFAGFQVD